MVDQIFNGWNPLVGWLSNIEALQSAIGKMWDFDQLRYQPVEEVCCQPCQALPSIDRLTMTGGML